MNGKGHILSGAAWLFGALIVELSLISPARAQDAQDKDYLEQVRRLNQIAAQKIEADIQAALRSASELQAKNPADAALTLRMALTRVEKDTALNENRRDTLIRTIQARLRFVDALARRSSNDVSDVSQPPRSLTSTTVDDAIQQGLATIARLRRDGKFDDARRLADALARRYPTNVAVQAASRSTGIGATASQSRTQHSDQERRLAALNTDIARSAMPAVGDVEFPKDWKEKLKRRANANPLTEKERAILQALNSTISVHFKDTPFQEAIKFLSEQLQQPILLDQASLQEALVDYKTPVNLEIPRVAARTALRKILSELGLSYVIRNQTIEVTTTVKAKQLMVTRSYYIGDLIGVGQFGGLIELQLGGALYTQQQAAKQIQQIIELIQSSIEPGSWGDSGGAISFHAPSMTLVIKQSAEVHGILSGYLK